jgi:hypothetical protein
LSARSKKASEMFSPIALAGDQIDNEIELRRLLERHVSGFCPAQNLVHVFGGVPEHTRVIWSVAHQTSRLDEFREGEHPSMSAITPLSEA